VRADGTRFPVEVQATLVREQDRPVALQGVARDITERRRLEAHLAESQRLTGIAQTAAMIGHDLRNPLQAIATTTHLMRKQIESTPSDEKKLSELDMLDRIHNSVRYMDKIVTDLQSYAEPRLLKLTQTNLMQLLQESLQISHVPSNIKLTMNTTEESVLADQSIIRVFTNLTTNAIQAMPNGGELTIDTERVGKQVSIHFQDTGVGIPKENMTRIFDPLFTTKAQGQGFGLSVCKRIVEAHQGDITVESTIGKGTRFTVKLLHER
jgi:signal transduction histidine kinase